MATPRPPRRPAAGNPILASARRVSGAPPARAPGRASETTCSNGFSPSPFPGSSEAYFYIRSCTCYTLHLQFTSVNASVCAIVWGWISRCLMRRMPSVAAFSAAVDAKEAGCSWCCHQVLPGQASRRLSIPAPAPLCPPNLPGVATEARQPNHTHLAGVRGLASRPSTVWLR